MCRLVSLLQKFFCKSPAQRCLLLEALSLLMMSRLALSLFSFRRITRLLNRPFRRTEADTGNRETLRTDVSWAITAVADNLPIPVLCFPRGIAAQAMLRRRGINATLFYGVAKLPEYGFKTHVWVQDGSEGVIGHQIAHHYTVLTSYPETN